MNELDPKEILVRAQDTPNPNALKFIVNGDLKSEGKATFYSAADCEGMPLVQTLFEIPGVRQVYLFQNTLTVTHTGELPPEIVKEQVKAVILTRLPVHNPDFTTADEPVAVQPHSRDRSHLSPEVQQIEEILDRTVRPGLQSDGGDIDVISFEDNILRVLYQGACGGCPSSMMGTLDAIQSILSHEMGLEDLQVIPV